MSRYNLIEEKWIPVRDLQGKLVEPGLGIRDTLLNAENLSTIEDPSPLVTAALYRFLLAILYRALKGPCDTIKAKELFKNGLPKDKIEKYLKDWKDRFWLFDEKYPFGQVPEFKPKVWRSWTAIAAEHNADTAKVLFDHIDARNPGCIPLSLAVRWLLGTNVFTPSIGKSELSYTGASPSANSLLAIPIGKNLHDTLLFCLVPEQNSEVLKYDLPIWERDPETVEYLTSKTKIKDKKSGKMKDRAVERIACGIADLYTWRSRSVIFQQDDSDAIKELGLASGIGYADSQMVDPMEGFIIREVTDEETKKKVEKSFAIQFEERGIWRDFDSLLPDDTQSAPKTIENALLLSKNNKERKPMGVLVLGQRYFPPRPNIAFWRSEFFILPEAMINDKYTRNYICQFLTLAKEVCDVLWKASREFAEDHLCHGDSKNDRNVDSKDIQKFIEQMNVEPVYWSTLESAFHLTLHEFSVQKDPYDIQYNWTIAVRNALSSAWQLHERSIAGGDAWTIRAFVKASGIVGGKIKELNETIEKLKPPIKTNDSKEAS